MKRILVLLCIVTGQWLYSQQQVSTPFGLQKEDSALITKYLKTAVELANHNYLDSAIGMADSAVNLSDRKKWDYDEARSLESRGYLQGRNGNYTQHLADELDAYELYEKVKDSMHMCKVLVHIGILYKSVEDHGLSRLYEMKAYKIAKAMNDPHRTWEAAYNLGNALANMDSVVEALKYYEESRLIALNLNDSRQNFRMAWSLHGLGRGEMLMNKLKKRKIKLGKFEESEEYAQEYAKVENVHYLFSDLYQSYAEAYVLLGDYTAAMKYSERSLAEADSINYIRNKLIAYRQLAKIYEEKGDVKKTLRYYKNTVEYSDRMFNAKNRSAVNFVTKKEDDRQREIIERKQQEQEDMENEKEEKALTILFVVIFVCIVTFAVVYLLFSRTILANPVLIRLLGLVALLFIFEFFNLWVHHSLDVWLHKKLGDAAYYAPAIILLAMVMIASIVIPAHHWLEKKVIEYR